MREVESDGTLQSFELNEEGHRTIYFYPTMTMPTANSYACFPSPNQLYPTLSLLTTNAHARVSSSNQFYPTTRLSTTNSCSPPNFAFTNVLQSQNCMTHLNQDAFPCGFEEHQDVCNS
ncbi:protein FAR1-RELATED SEQUENCE 5-like [Pyrus ussuriensis x Pyrus communis]|uniref:Protein FAR1-RELATED SEQUENCE 5-like n=1 Tax=Pyrus ussuriensis x Pyrus communis TaxID=2448454 RepID=A0A5N5F8U8_9ROSA|nr:protein FAR1-RELATED SEQUENCE 5-like [Pyrus ussuriensis x Pyrus communis]